MDTNETMLEEFSAMDNPFLGTTKLDVARYVTQEIVATAQQHSSTIKVVAVIVLRTPSTNHHFDQHDPYVAETALDAHRRLTNQNDGGDDNDNSPKSVVESSNDDDVIFPNLTEWPGNDTQLLPNIEHCSTLPRRIKRQKLSGTRDHAMIRRGDFLNGLILGTDSLYRYTTISQTERKRRILLLTDGKHKAHHVDHQQLLVAMDSLKRMNCRLDVLFMRDEEAGDNAEKASGDQNDTGESDGEGNDEDNGDDDDEDDNRSDDEESDDDEAEEETIQVQNESLLRNLAEKLEGTFLVSNNFEEILLRIVGRSNDDDGSTWSGTIGRRTALHQKQKCIMVYDEASIAPSAIKTQGPRREFSLSPGVGMRIHWNGNDDVPLREWLYRIRPSQYSNDVCAWIQVKNVNQNSPGFFRNINDDNNTDDDNDEDMVDFEVSMFDKYRIPLNDITKIIQSGKRVSNVIKEKCVEEIMRLAKKDKETIGKWLVYVSPAQADEVWEKIARATALGYLGCSSKIAPTANNQDRPTVICVYVQDSTNKREVQRVLKTLYYDLKITSGLNSFKPDIFTYLGIYANNRWRLKPTLYSWKDAMAWELEEDS